MWFHKYDDYDREHRAVEPIQKECRGDAFPFGQLVWAAVAITMGLVFLAAWNSGVIGWTGGGK